MQRRLQKICLGLTLGCLVSVVWACQNTSDTAQQPAPDPAEQPTTPPENVASQTPAEEPTPSSEPTETQPTNTAPATPTPEESTPQITDTPVPPLPAECSNPQTQNDMNRCAEVEYEQADAKLNNAYKVVQATLEGPQSEQLVAAEQAWIAYRDIYCDFVQTQFAGGSIQPTVYYGCLTQLTSDRTAELEQSKSTAMGYEEADQELNIVYQDLQSYLTPEEQGLLTDAQLEWINYRDSHCAFDSGDMNTCLAQVTETRVKQLREQLDTRSL